MTLPETVFVLTTWKDQEYFTETRPGYSLNDAFEDIASGTITDIRAVYIASNGSFEDESDQICDLLIERIRDGHMIDYSAKRFIEWCSKTPLEWDSLEDAA